MPKMHQASLKTVFPASQSCADAAGSSQKQRLAAIERDAIFRI